LRLSGKLIASVILNDGFERNENENTYEFEYDNEYDVLSWLTISADTKKCMNKFDESSLYIWGYGWKQVKCAIR
jgi:hypothetical protein